MISHKISNIQKIWLEIQYPYSANNHASGLDAITGNRDCLSVVFTGNAIHLLTEYLLNKSINKLGIN